GFSMHARGLGPRLIEFAEKLTHTHLPTLAVGMVTLAVIAGVRRLVPRAPAALLGIIGAVIVVYGLGLEERGVAGFGKFAAGVPHLPRARFYPAPLTPPFRGAVGVALVGLSHRHGAPRTRC